MDSLDMTLPANASPPDFDFNLPCRFFKSSFARSLSLTNASINTNGPSKSLDYEILRSKNNNSIGINNNKSSMQRELMPPIPQKRTTLDGCQNEVTKKPVSIDSSRASNDVKNDKACDNEKPPALPARRPINGINNNTQKQQQQQQQQQQQSSLTQLRQQAFNQALSPMNAAILPPMQLSPQQQQQQQQHNQQHFSQHQHQKHINHYAASSNGNSNNHDNIHHGNNKHGNNNNNISNGNGNFRSNLIVWPNTKNVEQEFHFYDEDDNDDDIHSEYHDTTKLSTNNEYQAININKQQQQIMVTTNQQQQQQQQHHHQQQHQHHQQQSQHLQQIYDVEHDNTTNVEAVILQNQVDSLQWQLKQVETSCDMYRAVMEEVARFLERYQKQRQQSQTQKSISSNSNIKGSNGEQMSRSKSLYQVYNGPGENDKSTMGKNSDVESTSSSSYLRARSSTNLIDLKQNANPNQKLKNPKGHSKDDHNYETESGLTPAQSYSAFKDYTWRRSPKKANDKNSLSGHDDVDEKLNQEAFRLLRTIHNLLNTSQHQPDLGHYNNHHQTSSQLHHNLYHRHSLAATTSALNMGRISKAISTTSVATLPGAPLHNSTSLTLGANCASSTASESSTTSPTMTGSTANTLAPEMLFLRTTNMRDSRLSLRSSTDSSVHSSSSAASTISSKVETDEEPSTPFHSPPNNNILVHKQQQHHHLAGSSTEDESGFSSISSFPDIGVPLSSTLLSNAPPNKNRPLSKDLKSSKPAATATKTTTHSDNEKEQLIPINGDSRNSTLKANVVGLPLNASQDMSHRWDSPSKTYHNASTKFQRFSALSNEDSNTVLWV